MSPSQQHSSERNANQEDFHQLCSYQLNHSLLYTSQPSWSGTFPPTLRVWPGSPRSSSHWLTLVMMTPLHLKIIQFRTCVGMENLILASGQVELPLTRDRLAFVLLSIWCLTELYICKVLEEVPMSNKKTQRGLQLHHYVPYSRAPRSHKGPLLSGSANCLPWGGTDSPWDSTNNLVLSVGGKHALTPELTSSFLQFIDYDISCICQ